MRYSTVQYSAVQPTHHNAILLIRGEESVHLLEVELLVQSRVVYIRPDGAVHL